MEKGKDNSNFEKTLKRMLKTPPKPKSGDKSKAKEVQRPLNKNQ